MEGARVKLVAVLALIALVAVAPLEVAGVDSGACTLTLVAVSSAGEGVTSNLTVRVARPGSGLIFVSTSPAVEVDVQGAARIAVLAASIVGGFNPLEYDYYFIISSPAIIVGGPSAGAAMALAVLLAVEGASCGGDFVVTGMINPDTTIGPVGGLREKLEAAASAGAKTFFIPEGQARYTYYERVVVRRGPFTFVTLRPETVDLKEYGGKLGVRVVEVADLASLYSMVTGASIAYKSGGLVDSPTMRRAAESVIGEAEKLASRLEGLRGGLVENALNSLNQARGALEGGQSSYLALLKALEALTLAQTALWSSEGLDIEAVYNNASRALEEFNARYSEVEAVDTGVIVAKGLAYVHAWSAGMLLNSTYPRVRDRGFAALDDALNMARALWEARVANIILASIEPEGAPVDGRVLELLSKYMVATARSLAAYSKQLFEEAGLGSPPEEATLMAISASVTRDPVAALFLAITSMSILTSAIHESFKAGDVLGRVEEIAGSLAASTGSREVQGLARAAIESKSYTLLTQSILASWSISHMTRGAEESIRTAQPQPGAAPQITQEVKVTDIRQYSLVRELLETIVGSSIRALTIASIALAVVAVIAYIALRRSSTPS